MEVINPNILSKIGLDTNQRAFISCLSATLLPHGSKLLYMEYRNILMPSESHSKSASGVYSQRIFYIHFSIFKFVSLISYVSTNW